MIEYQDCPSCGVYQIRTTSSKCDVCFTAERCEMLYEKEITELKQALKKSQEECKTLTSQLEAVESLERMNEEGYERDITVLSNFVDLAIQLRECLKEPKTIINLSSESIRLLNKLDNLIYLLKKDSYTKKYFVNNNLNRFIEAVEKWIDVSEIDDDSDEYVARWSVIEILKALKNDVTLKSR